MIFGTRKLESWCYRAALFAWSYTFSRFDTIPKCDRHTQAHTHRHTTTAYIALSIASRGKNWVVWEVMGHRRSLAAQSFDRAHTTSYLAVVECVYLVLFSSYIKFLSNMANFNPLHSAGGWPSSNFAVILVSENQSFWVSCNIICVILSVSRFDIIRECDRRTHEQTGTRRRHILC